MTASLQIVRMSSGAEYYYYFINYRDPVTQRFKKKKVSTGLEVKNNKRKAQAMKQDILNQYAYLEDYCPPKPEILFCDFLKRWMRKKEVEVKRSTFEGYECHMSKILEYFEPRGYLLRDITPGILDSYFCWCLKFGKVHQKTGERSGLAPRTVRDYKNLLYAAFDRAIVEGLIQTNPAAAVKVCGNRGQSRDEEYMFLTQDEIEKLLRFLDGHPKYAHLKPMAFIAVYYGLRRSELLGLTWDAIDYDANLMHIRQTVVRVKTCEISDLTKTPAGRRDLFLFPLAKKCLNEVRAAQEENRRFYGAGFSNPENFVFTWPDGRPYDPNLITKHFRKAMIEFGKPTITLHSLRHTCASLLIEKGWDVKQAQYWLGHVDIETTLNIYAHYNKKRLNAVQTDFIDLTACVGDLFS